MINKTISKFFHSVFDQFSSISKKQVFIPEEGELVYKHCYYCNGIFKQNAPNQSYCSYLCKNSIGSYINNHHGLNLGLSKNTSPMYRDKPSAKLLAKYPNNANWFKDFLIDFKKENNHLYWKVNEVSDFVRREENRIVRRFKEGQLSQQEILEFEEIGFKWTRKERKEEMDLQLQKDIREEIN